MKLYRPEEKGTTEIDKIPQRIPGDLASPRESVHYVHLATAPFRPGNKFEETDQGT